ncbi:MAG: tripartite tricarboxylate transporter substrate binding protein [Phycisphaerales bacterium]|nr:tripartite tricarboxylate transporter substrate binding protein [Phycisphaerales bacterium]
MQRIVGLLAALLLSGAVCAQQGYPNRTMRIVIPWPPGQATDLVGRLVALKLSEVFGQQVVADNRAGAGGMIGTDFAAKATPDGYTLLAASSGPVTISPLLQKTPYDPARDLIPVANAGLSPYILVTGTAFPAASARDLVNLIKANPGKFTFASSGTGATAHLVAEWFNAAAGLQATHVPYKGSTPALTDVVSGQVAYATETLAATLPHIKAGRLKAHGISLARGSTLVPDIPPLATTLGLQGFDVGAWIGVMVPAGTPRPVIDRLAAAMDKVMQAPDSRERLGILGLETDYRPPQDFAQYLKAQSARFAEIIRKGNIRIE